VHRTGPGFLAASAALIALAGCTSTGPDAEEVLPAGPLVVVRGITYNCGVCPGPFVPAATDLYNPVGNT
jgi:hypothetical protein